jgi:mono/diheme cytochrome c family protein
MNIKRILAIVGLVCSVLGLYYADLLASAFARNPFPHSAESVARGKSLFERYCVSCHGVTGNGEGPALPLFRLAPKTCLSLRLRRSFLMGW